MLDAKKLSDDQHALLFGVRRSIRYHDRRTGFFDSLHRITNALTVLLAGMVFVELLDGNVPHALQWLAGVSATLSIIDFVLGYSQRADAHRSFKRQFGELEADIVVSDLDNTEQWKSFSARRVRIESNEPPVYRALDLLCQNELLLASGYTRQVDPADFSYLKLKHRLTAHLLRWSDIANDTSVVRV